MNCYDEYASEYDAWFMKNGNLLASEVKLIAKVLAGGGDILSIGCGSGLMESILKRDFGIVVADGVEPSPGMAEIARKRGLNVLSAVAVDFPVTRQYATVLMNGCPSYIDDLDASFVHAAEALKPGGRLVVADVPKDSAYAMIYNLAAAIGTWDDPLLADIRPPDPYPIEFVKSANWRTTEEKVASLRRCGFFDFAYYQTLTMHPVRSNRFVEEPSEGSDRGSYVAIVARRVPFLEQLKDGTLPRAAFDRYVCQDALYLRRHAEALVALAGKLDRAEDKRLFENYAQAGVDAERQMLREYANDNRMPDEGCGMRLSASIWYNIHLMQEMTIEELIGEIRRGARVTLMVRHGERPKMDPDDPTFGDALELTYEGTRTAKKLGAALREFAGDVLFAASPLTRTRMTAACIAEGMGVADAAVPTDELLGNGSFYYDDPAEVLDVFKPKNFFPACIEYFRTAHQRGFRELYAATDEFERWIDARWKSRLFVIATHDLYIAAFLYARKVGEFSKENWPRFLDGGAVIEGPDGARRYALVRTGLSTGIVGVRRPKISGVVFDFGGVMTTSTMPERVRKCTEEFGIDWQHLADGFARYRRLMDGGFMTIEELYDLIWADADISLSPEMQSRILKEDFASFMEGYRNQKTLEWMKALKASGRKIGILTNMPPSMAPRFKVVFADFIALADAMVISGEERMFKPQRRIYDLLRKRIGLPAEELCFIDDTEPNCEGARRAGWHAVRFEDNAQVVRDFGRLVG